MLSHEHKFIFIHINKTGGSSIEQFFCGQYENIPAKHVPVSYYRGKYPGYFRFSFVRNPWDKVVSQYEFRKRTKDCYTFPEGMTFDEFIHKPIGRPLQNQLDWITIRGRIAVDFIGRYETLQRDFNAVCRHIGIEPGTLPHIHKSDRKHYREYYTDETREIVHKIFSRDIEYFNYKY